MIKKKKKKYSFEFSNITKNIFILQFVNIKMHAETTLSIELSVLSAS